MRFLHSVIVACCLVQSWAGDGVRIEPLQADVTPDAAATEVTVSWRLINDGQKARQFTAHPCHCSEIIIHPNPLPAGATGTVLAILPISEQAGRYERQVRLQVDDATAPLTLTAVLHLPPTPAFTPGFVTWRRGETPVGRDLTVTVPESLPTTVTAVTTSDARLHATLTTCTQPGTWRITVTPSTTESAFGSHIIITTADGRMYKAYAQVW